MLLSKTHAYGEEEALETPDPTEMLSRTARDNSIGQTYHVSFEPQHDVVKVNAKDDWDALVLYVKKEDILRNQGAAALSARDRVSKALATKNVSARTFVYGQDQKGNAKWRKVPLQIISDTGEPFTTQQKRRPWIQDSPSQKNY